jgi:hypothetical protein
MFQLSVVSCQWSVVGGSFPADAEEKQPQVLRLPRFAVAARSVAQDDSGGFSFPTLATKTKASRGLGTQFRLPPRTHIIFYDAS